MKTKELVPHGEVGHFCDGGCASYAEGGEVPDQAPTDTDKNDPSDLPEDVREYVEKQHKAIRESRPDENWRIKPMEKAENMAPYKREEEEEKAEEDAGIPHFDEGGQVDQVPDQNALFQEIAPPGTGTLSPSPAATPPMAAPIAPPPVPKVMAPPPPPLPPAPALTDQDYVNKANKMMGLNPQEQAAFMKLLGGNSQKAQIGAAVAGVGDAIASGGTLGKVNPGNLSRSEDLIQGNTKAGIEGMQTIRGNQEKALEEADKLEARDPKSPLSKWAQKAYGPVGKKIGLNLDNASASLIGDVTGKGVEALNTEFQSQMKIMGLDLQKKQVEATIGNQKAEREAQKASNVQGAAKALSDKGALKSLVDMIPGTAGHAANKVLERQAAAGNFTPDVTAYAEKNGITPEQAQAIKDKRTGGQ